MHDCISLAFCCKGIQVLVVLKHLFFWTISMAKDNIGARRLLLMWKNIFRWEIVFVFVFVVFDICSKQRGCSGKQWLISVKWRDADCGECKSIKGFFGSALHPFLSLLNYHTALMLSKLKFWKQDSVAENYQQILGKDWHLCFLHTYCFLETRIFAADGL